MSDHKVVSVVVPQVGEGAADLVLSGWLKKVGDRVEDGEDLFELDTEKATVTVQAFASGVLAEIVAAAGSIVSPLEVVAIIHEDPQ